MSMELTALTIRKKNTWDKGVEDYVCQVKINSDKAAIECYLDASVANKIVELCKKTIVENAKKTMDDFESSLMQLEGPPND